MMEGQCNSCGKYLWDRRIHEERDQLQEQVTHLQAVGLLEREACARICLLLAGDLAEVNDHDGSLAARMCAALIRARGDA